jgi:hypothetical protein
MDTNHGLPVIVTCWHVVSNGTFGKIFLALGSSNIIEREEDHFTAVVPEFKQHWVRHPDTNVDLAVMPIGPIMEQLRQKNKTIDWAPIYPDMIPSQTDLKEYGVFEDVKFVGYPIGMWDEKHNLPIVRRGMTASDPTVDYNGRREFLIDAAVFPGSSGSPVYIADDNATFRAGDLRMPQVKLLGILYECYLYTPDESVVIIPIPTAFQLKAKAQIPAGIGVVIKAECLDDFRPKLLQMIRMGLERGGNP